MMPNTNRKTPRGFGQTAKALTIEIPLQLVDVATKLIDITSDVALDLGNDIKDGSDVMRESVKSWKKATLEEISEREAIRNEPTSISKRKAFYRADERRILEELYGSTLTLEEQKAEIDKDIAERDANNSTELTLEEQMAKLQEEISKRDANK